jgi:hypothetical protein
MIVDDPHAPVPTGTPPANVVDIHVARELREARQQRIEVVAMILEHARKLPW